MLYEAVQQIKNRKKPNSSQEKLSAQKPSRWSGENENKKVKIKISAHLFFLVKHFFQYTLFK